MPRPGDSAAAADDSRRPPPSVPNEPEVNDVDEGKAGASAAAAGSGLRPHRASLAEAVGMAGTKSHRISQLDVPEGIKSILYELDMDGTKEVDDEKMKEALVLMQALRKGLDVDGTGTVDKVEMEAGVALLTKLAKDRANNTSELYYEHMPDCIKHVLQSWDLDGSGAVSVTELAAAADAFTRVKNEGRMMKKIIIALAVVIALLMVGMFVLSMAAAEMVKESHVVNGKNVGTDGTVVATRSADFEVCSDGTMASYGKCPAAGTARRLLEDSPGDMLKTVTIKQKQTLASSLPDSVFMALDEIAIYSDKGHSLRLQIAGFARVPVLNSRCGNIVHLYTAWNGRVTLDSVDLSFDEETESAFANAGFSLITGGLGGRRLADEAVVDGFFNAVQDVHDAQKWACQDVPLPSLPETYMQEFKIHRPCAVEGVTGDTMDMCDSRYGGVVPGTKKLSRELQIATLSKTDRIRALLSVDVPLAETLFTSSEVELMKSDSYELQISKFPNHPGMLKVNYFDRVKGEDISFQLIESAVGDGRFFCNTSGTDTSPQKEELKAEQQGVKRDMHFEFLDMVEENEKILRHFRMMPAEAFLEWMGAKPASERPKDAYFEFWDDAETLTPVRILNPDGSLVQFGKTTGGITDADITARLAQLGSASWTSMTECTDVEMIADDNAHSATLDMAVPKMLSPMSDLRPLDVAFYARLHLDEQYEDNDLLNEEAGWITMERLSNAATVGPLTSFAKYAMRSKSRVSVPDICRDACPKEMAALEAELRSDVNLDICSATSLASAVACMADVATPRHFMCTKSNFMLTVSFTCIPAAERRRLEETGQDEADWEEVDDAQPKMGTRASDMYLKRLGLAHSGAGASPTGLRRLSDGTTELNLDLMEEAERAKLAKAIGIKELKGGRLFFNTTSGLEKEEGIVAVLQAKDKGAEVRRLFALDLNCVAPGVAPGCIFQMGMPYRCDPVDGNPKCTWGIAAKMQIGGPANGALSLTGTGCGAATLPPPLFATICVAGGISVSRVGACGNAFSLTGSVSITASCGLDLWVFSFTAASVGITGGASVEDNRRRRRAGCDMKVFLKGEVSFGIGRVWGEVAYWLGGRDLDFTIGADIRVLWWWENVAKAQIA